MIPGLFVVHITTHITLVLPILFFFAFDCFFSFLLFLKALIWTLAMFTPERGLSLALSWFLCNTDCCLYLVLVPKMRSRGRNFGVCSCNLISYRASVHCNGNLAGEEFKYIASMRKAVMGASSLTCEKELERVWAPTERAVS